MNNKIKINESLPTEKLKSDRHIAVENNLIQTNKPLKTDSYLSVNTQRAIEIVDEAVFSQTNRHLKDIEVSIIEGSCRGQNYEQIGRDYGYSGDYLRNDAGPNFWKFLSKIFQEKINKRNFRIAIERKVREQFKLAERSDSNICSETISQTKTTTNSLVDNSGDELVGNNTCEDWGEAPDIRIFYGRDRELATLKQWIVKERCRLLLLLGIGGIGKTALSVKLAQQLHRHFDLIIWRSLRNAPPLFELLSEAILFLSQQQETNLPTTVEARISLLLKYMRSTRCLFILDNGEAILETGLPAGRYRSGYQDYDRLFKCISETNHKSCLLLTARERPQGLTADEGEILPIRTLRLKGLSSVEGKKIFATKGTFSGSETEWESLNFRYSGNPLALKILASMVRDFFAGEIGQFLAVIEQGSFLFDDIQDLLQQQWQRLSDLEREIMYWLAINRELVSWQQLQQDLVIFRGTGEFLQAIGSLQHRSLIETGNSGLTQQPAVMEYVTKKLIESIARELIASEIKRFNHYALIKANAADYVRETQVRLILQPLIERLMPIVGSRNDLEIFLSQILLKLQREFIAKPGYATGNLLNLLRQLNIAVKGYDFSGLAIWQANFQGMCLHEVNLTNSDLRKSVFTQTFANIFSIAFSPDGELLAAVDSKGDIYQWQRSKRKLIWHSQGHDKWIWSVAFSPDGQILASGSTDSSIKLWDVENGSCLNTLSGHLQSVWSVAFSPDGQILASSSADCSIKFWDVENASCLNTLSEHINEVTSIAFRPDGKLLASGSGDFSLKLWDVKSGQCLKTLLGHNNWIHSVAFSANGKMLASGSADSSIKLWDVKSGQCLKTLSGHNNWVHSVAFSPDSKMLASGSADSSIRLWDVQTGKCLNTLLGYAGWIWSVVFSPDGQILASGSDDSFIKFWDVKNGQCLNTLLGYIDWVWSVTFSPDGEIVAGGNANSLIKLWNVNNGNCLNTLSEHTNEVTSIVFNPNAKIIASASGNCIIKLWDVNSGRSLKTLFGHDSWIWSVTFSSDGKLLASGSNDCSVKVWDVESGQCLKTFLGHNNWVFSVAFSPNGEMLASSSADFSIKFWDIKNSQCLKTLSAHTGWVLSICFSPDGKKIVSGSADSSIKLWDIESGQCLKTFLGHNNWVWSVAFSPNGKMLASGSADSSIKLWDVESFQCLRTLSTQSGWIWSIAFSPDGKILASGSQDGTIKLWDVNTGECLKAMRSLKPYEGTNITGAKGLTSAQKETLKLLGAVED